MTLKTRDKLIALGPEKLADALLELGSRYDEADELVERMVATPGEKMKQFKAKLSGLKRARSFIDWRGVGGFARKLEGMLVDLEESVTDGKTGVELVARFFECDRYVFERCDDSSGMVGDVFRHDASGLFVRFAADCPDKKWLMKLVIKLFGGNDYGVRDTLLKSAADFLPEKNIRELAKQFWQLAEAEKDKYHGRSWYRGVEELAELVGDAPLFEKARLVSWGEPPSTAACLDIADMYLKNGEAQTALDWIKRDKNPGTFQEDKRDKLLQTIYQEMGETDKVIEIAWKRFRGHRSIHGLNELLAVIGQEQKDLVIAEQAREILAGKTFSRSNAQFLLQTGCLDEAENYLLQSVGQFNGDFYESLLPLAQAMETEGRYLAAIMLYRALLDSILQRGYTKSYPHGIRYLKKLDTLALEINDWQRFPSHETYKKEVRLAHGRKHSFWGRYDK